MPQTNSKDRFAPPPSLLKRKSLQNRLRLAELAFAALSPLLPFRVRPSLNSSPDSYLLRLPFPPFLRMVVMASCPPKLCAPLSTVPWEMAARGLQFLAPHASGQSRGLVLINGLGALRGCPFLAKVFKKPSSCSLFPLLPLKAEGWSS